ncbi:MAG: potassium transporter Kef [Myxococcota bacterium]
MNAYAILVGLLVLAYAGDALRPAGRRAFGLSSGTEFLLVGVLLGPLGLGAVTRATLDALSPVTLVAASWLALLAGSHLGFADQRRVPTKRLALGFFVGVAAFAACALAGWAVAPSLLALGEGERLYLALGLGCAGSETARAAMVWGAAQNGGRGPLHDAFADLAEADDVVPLLGLAVLFAVGPQPEGAVLRGQPLLALGLTVGLGVVMGGLAAALTRVESRSTERWGILLGAGLLAIGLSMRLGLAAPAVLFLMGVTLNRVAKDGEALREMLMSTARPVLLPVVALAGAHLDLRDGRALWLAVGLVPLARLAVKLPAGALLRRHLGTPTPASPWMGLGLMASGGITICIGLTAAARFSGPVGRLILGACLATVVVGELLGPPSLRRELRLAGEAPGQAPAAEPVRAEGT